MKLPSLMVQFHNVFHVSMVRKCKSGRDTAVSEPPSDLRENLTVEGRPVQTIDVNFKPNGSK